MLSEHKLLKKRGEQRTDSTHIVVTVRHLNRLETIGETMCATLNILAIVCPDWLQQIVPTIWYDRYETRIEEWGLPRQKKEREAWVLAEKDCLPGTHLADVGYLDAEQIVDSQEKYAVKLFGPARPDVSWQTKAQAGYTNQVIRVRFPRQKCRSYVTRSLCTQSATQPRFLTLRQQAQHEALQTVRREQQTKKPLV